MLPSRLMDPAPVTRPNLFGLSKAELERELVSKGLPAYRGRQLYRWMYARGVTDLESMSDLPKSLRLDLAKRFRVEPPSVAEQHTSSDGTVKYRMRFEDSLEAETVYIPDPPGIAAEATRHTFCLSTQVGCPLKCSFCFSGTIPLERNLEVGDILGQFLVARNALETVPDRTNIVFMGMGEPLLNRRNVESALEILTDPDGFAVSPRRITVSTAGLVDELERFAQSMPAIGLAISLHATNDASRTALMPINKKHSIRELMNAARRLPLPKRRRITFEYVLLRDENDSLRDAEALAELLEGIPAKVNVISYNPWPGSPHRKPLPDTVHRFIERLASAGVTVSLRKSRGDDVLAACGQLANQSK